MEDLLDFCLSHSHMMLALRSFWIVFCCSSVERFEPLLFFRHSLTLYQKQRRGHGTHSSSILNFSFSWGRTGDW